MRGWLHAITGDPRLAFDDLALDLDPENLSARTARGASGGTIHQRCQFKLSDAAPSARPRTADALKRDLAAPCRALPRCSQSPPRQHAYAGAGASCWRFLRVVPRTPCSCRRSSCLRPTRQCCFGKGGGHRDATHGCPRVQCHPRPFVTLALLSRTGDRPRDPGRSDSLVRANSWPVDCAAVYFIRFTPPPPHCTEHASWNKGNYTCEVTHC